jgi:5-methylcytosine-specific restriction endonuclease McrA
MTKKKEKPKLFFNPDPKPFTGDFKLTTPKKLKTKKKPKKEKITVASHNAVWLKYMKKKQKGKCYCCKQQEVTFINFFVGHNKARSKQGSNHISNLRPICRDCNLAMGNRYTIEAFRKKFFAKKRKKKVKKHGI